MCGICAVLGNEVQSAIKKMCQCLQHSGPDDEGFFFSQNLALGHRTLFVDDQRAHQPLANENETIWITFDGEIYNSGELRKRLEKNHGFRTNSHAEVVVHAYEESGPECVSSFNGMFVFCLWDSIKGMLFCVRDKIGIKQLYYYRCPNHLLFASEIKALLTDPAVLRKPNESVIYDYLITGLRSRPEDTFFMGIKQLLPGHYMLVRASDDDEVLIRSYWNPLLSLKPDSSKKDDQYYACRFRELLEDSIKLRLPAELPVGACLSGGIDSTSMVCLTNNVLMSNDSAKPLELFSAIYEEQVADESGYIGEVADAVAGKVNYFLPSNVLRWEDIRQFVYDMDEPVGDLGCYIYWLLARVAKEKRVNVILFGQGPDEFLAGYYPHYRVYFWELWRKRKFARLFMEFVSTLSPARRPSIVNYLIELFRTSSESKVRRFLAPRFAANHSLKKELALYYSGEINRITAQEDASLNDCLLRDVTRIMLPDFNRINERACSAFSVKFRYPYLDHRMIEFAFSLPVTQKIRNGRTKYIMRNAMKNIIPETVKKRAKFATPVPLVRWMRDLCEIRKAFESSEFCERGYFNQPAILNMYDRLSEGKLDALASAYYGDMLWRILNLELWFETFF